MEETLSEIKAATAKVARAITDHSLLPAGATAGVALSGGADSVALLDMLHSLGFRCVALHCNFHLRGDESDRDEAFCRRLTASMGVPIHVAQMDVPARRAATGESVEMACRELRYRWFADMARLLGLDAVAVAHHRDDQAETFFLNLTRGAGARGLSGMKPRNGLIIRPMLGLTRAEINRYLALRGLGHITDSTNSSDLFSRNRIRNRLLPLFESLFPGVGGSIASSMLNLADQAALLDDYTAVLSRRHSDADGVIDLRSVIDGESHPAAVLYQLLRDNGFNRSTVADIIRSASGSGLTFTADGGSYRLNRGKLIPVADAPAVADEEVTFDPADGLDAPLAISCEIVSRDSLGSLRCPPWTLLLDADALQGSPRWTLRHWREGDRLKPFGLRGSRLVSDIFSDDHLSVDDKARRWMLTRDGEIIWIPGMRSSRHFAVTAATRRVVRLSARPYF